MTNQYWMLLIWNIEYLNCVVRETCESALFSCLWDILSNTFWGDSDVSRWTLDRDGVRGWRSLRGTCFRFCVPLGRWSLREWVFCGSLVSQPFWNSLALLSKMGKLGIESNRGSNSSNHCSSVFIFKSTSLRDIFKCSLRSSITSVYKSISDWL